MFARNCFNNAFTAAWRQSQWHCQGKSQAAETAFFKCISRYFTSPTKNHPLHDTFKPVLAATPASLLRVKHIKTQGLRKTYKTRMEMILTRSLQTTCSLKHIKHDFCKKIKAPGRLEYPSPDLHLRAGNKHKSAQKLISHKLNYVSPACNWALH